MRYSSRYLDESDYSDIQIAINKNLDILKDTNIISPADFFSLFQDKIISQDKFLVGLFDPNEEIIGLIYIIKDYPEEHNWFINTFFISQDNRNNGLGKVIFDDIEEWILDLDANSISIDISKSPQSINFFKSLGFKQNNLDNDFFLKKEFTKFF